MAGGRAPLDGANDRGDGVIAPCAGVRGIGRAATALLVALALGGAACVEETVWVRPDVIDRESPIQPATDITIVVLGVEADEVAAGALKDALDVRADEMGITILYEGDYLVGGRLAEGAGSLGAPDVAIVSEPRLVLELAARGAIEPMPRAVVDRVRGQWPTGALDAVTQDGQTWALMHATEPKSLVWYDTAVFAAGGHTVPTTWQELLDLSGRLIAEGVTPWCVGIESGTVTGWVFTDWVEDVVIRRAGPEVYDGWAERDIDFSDPRVLAAAEEVLALWSTPRMVHAGSGRIETTYFADAARDLADGRCAMHRLGATLPAYLPPNVTVGPDGAIDVFVLPGIEPDRAPVIVEGTYVVALRDAPEVWDVVGWLGSGDGVTARQRAQAARTEGRSVFLSANLEQDITAYDALGRALVAIMRTATPMRHDASTRMPPGIGAGTFLTEGTEAVAGRVGLAQAFRTIDRS